MISYPSDISRQQFELIRPDLETWRQRTCLRQVDLYEILNAVPYILRIGSQRRQLLHEFPNCKRFMVTSAAGQNRLM